MAGKRGTKAQPQPEAIVALQAAVRGGDDWFDALLQAIALWEAPEEDVDGRRYHYLIAGEAFDWLLLAERLCDALEDFIPVEEQEALLFFGRPPRALSDGEFKRAIGDNKHRAHLNFMYGIAAEEALQLTVEEEVLKQWRSCAGWNREDGLEQQVFERVYGRSQEELLAAFRAERALPPADEISYGELRAFTYWLFKYRVNQSDPARVASDTRKALAQVSELEAAARRRMGALNATDGGSGNGIVVDGEVVGRLR